jgi:hypothetical protein
VSRAAGQEMHAFDQCVGGEQQFAPGRYAGDGGIVTDAQSYIVPMRPKIDE